MEDLVVSHQFRWKAISPLHRLCKETRGYRELFPFSGSRAVMGWNGAPPFIPGALRCRILSQDPCNTHEYWYSFLPSSLFGQHMQLICLGKPVASFDRESLPDEACIL